MNLSSLSGTFAHFSIDWILIVVLIVLITLDAMRSGSGRATTLAFAVPLTLILSTALSQAAILGSVTAQFSGASAQLILFAAIFIVLFLIVSRIIDNFSGTRGLLSAIIPGVAAAVILLVVWLQVPGLQILWHFGPQVQAVFGEAYRFWWLIAAYAAFAFVRS